ncbi:MAG TPA: VWA domain-containing protein [Gemmataceae bacterium]|nr:VWA domain-containing protein [Gemmataceae bacterium]
MKVEFANPWCLLFLPVVPLFVWWWLKRPRQALPFSDLRFLVDLSAGNHHWMRRVGAGLRGAGLLLAILALADPRWPDVHRRIATEGIAIQMLADISGSMAEKDFDWQGEPINRLEAVKKVFTLFVLGGEGPDGHHLEGRPTDLIGLISFATWPETTCPLTLSHTVLIDLLEKKQPRTGPTESQSNIGDAIAWGLYRLENARTSRKVMVLLSDGEHNVPPPALTPRQAAQLAATKRVPIYTIDAGGDAEVNEASPGVEAPTAATIRQSGIQALQAVSQITGGRYFRARDTQSLLTVCREIDRLERQEIQSFLYQPYWEGYPWAGLGAFLCWMVIFILERTVWLKVP